MMKDEEIQKQLSELNGLPFVVVSDFDGTITKADSIKFLLKNHADEGWKKVQTLIDDGKINEVEGLSRLLEHLSVDWDAAIKSIRKAVELDSDFDLLLLFLKEHGIPLIIVSSGLTDIICPVLQKYRSQLPLIIANRLNRINGGLEVVNPYSRFSVGYQNTKEAVVHFLKQQGSNVIYAGDGFSDFIPAILSDVVFAKADLRASLKDKGHSYKNLSRLKDIVEYLKNEIDED